MKLIVIVLAIRECNNRVEGFNMNNSLATEDCIDKWCGVFGKEITVRKRHKPHQPCPYNIYNHYTNIRSNDPLDSSLRRESIGIYCRLR